MALSDLVGTLSRAPTPGTLFVLVVASAIVGALLALGLRRRLERRRVRLRQQRGIDAEHEAAVLLRASGYRVVAAQVEAEGEMRIDGEPEHFVVRVDFIVRRWWRRYVAEVKTGRGSDPIERHTRRQLREYAALFPGHGLLLVDMDERVIYRVEL